VGLWDISNFLTSLFLLCLLVDKTVLETRALRGEGVIGSKQM
jgi:hypothetical protein